MSKYSSEIAGLTLEQRALLELRLRQRSANAAAPAAGIARREGDGPAPLSFAQKGLWFLNQLEPESPLYSCPCALRMEGELDVDALERTLNEVVRRHEVLRTIYPSVDGKPVQEVRPALRLTLAAEDLSDAPGGERDARARLLIAEEARKPFDLARGPLIRVRLLRLGAREHVVLLTMHHIIADRWSSDVLVRETSALYDAFSKGRPSPLPELSVQYADYAAWEQRRFEGGAQARGTEYWTRQLAAAPPLLELPTDRPRPKEQSFRGARHTFALPRHLSDGLKELSRREGATMFMTLLAGFKALLHRYTNQADLLIGTPVANRNQVEAEKLIGFFVNTLVLRTRVSGAQSFRGLLADVRETCLGAYSHPDVPFEKLVEELHPERDQSRNPLFQVMFVLQNAPQTTLTLSGLKLRSLEVETGTAMLDLMLSMEDGEEGLRGAFEYNTDLFDAGTIGRMAAHFGQLLSGVVARPDQRVSELPLLTGDELHQILSGWNETRGEYPKHLCVQDLVARQAARTPEAVAVECGGERLTYAELDSRANRLSRYLRRRGVSGERPVAVMMERSTSLVVALLGVLKAGGAYVPLDPAYPQERLRWMLEDSGAPLVLTERGLAGRVPVGEAAVVALDAEWAEVGRESGSAPEWEVSGEQLAYVIYTSGSTGRPKGVMVLQRSVVNIIWSMKERPGLSASDTFAAVTTLSFDIAALELFLPLTVGARLVVIKSEVAADGRRLAATLAETRATAMQATPATWRLLLDAGWSGSGSFKIMCGGEALPHELAKRLLDGGASLWNVYGPTETTIWSTVRRIGPEDARVLIGRPIANTTVYVLDPNGRPVPAGVPGELHIGGDGVARGYYKRPGLTAERFVPAAQGAGERLYRTGDLARFLPDGDLEVLGRLDHQVKVRGFRIELGEVEDALSKHPGVREAVAVVREDAPGNKQLVGYLAAEAENSAPSLAELRGFLKEKLPEYMIPSVFVTLDALPRTPNGKVDRRSLPAPSEGRLEAGREFVAARTAVEEVLCGIWEEILGAGRVGVHDNFFELGGHSLLATQVLSRVRRDLEADVPLRGFFESPTVAGLAAGIESRRGAGRALTPPLLPAGRADAELPLSFAQQRLWFLDQLEPGSPFYNIHAAVRLRGSLNVPALGRSLDEIIARHESLRTVFKPAGGRPVQVVKPAPGPALDLTDLSGEPGPGREAACRLAMGEEALRPFDLERGPLFRARLLRLDAEEHVLLLTMHHIISDGWSMGVVVREFGALYEAFAAGAESPLAPLPIQYADFARWQREWLQGEALEALLSYWKQHLAGAPPVLQLPLDRPRPAVQSFSGARQKFAWDAGLLEELRAACRREGVTLFMLLLAAFDAFLHHRTKQTDIVVGSDVANRNLLETEGLIGFFVNQVALRVSTGGDPDFRELLGRARSAALGAYAHQDAPFEKVVEAVNPKRSLQQSPLIQVKLVLGNIPIPRLNFAGLEMTPLELENETSQLDMIWHVVEAAEGLTGFVEYNTELFNASTVEGWMKSVEAVLRRVASSPETRLSELADLAGDRPAPRLAAARPAAPGLPNFSDVKRRPIRRPAQAGAPAPPASELIHPLNPETPRIPHEEN